MSGFLCFIIRAAWASSTVVPAPEQGTNRSTFSCAASLTSASTYCWLVSWLPAMTGGTATYLETKREKRVADKSPSLWTEERQLGLEHLQGCSPRKKGTTHAPWSAKMILQPLRPRARTRPKDLYICSTFVNLH